jgi:hypothetical protein
MKKSNLTTETRRHGEIESVFPVTSAECKTAILLEVRSRNGKFPDLGWLKTDF